MRVWFLSSTFPEPYAPTRGIYCWQLCKAMRPQHRVEVICPRSWLETLQYRRELRNVAVKDENSWEGISVCRPVYYYPPRLMPWTYAWWMERSVRSIVKRLLARQGPPDCLISYWAHPDGAVAARIGKQIGAPTAIIVGGSDVLQFTRNARRRRCIQDALNAADAVVAVSQDLRSRVIELGVSPAKAHVVLQGIDQEVFCPADRQKARAHLGLSATEPALLWVGRMVPVKGLDLLLHACQALKDHGQLFHLYLVGDGPLQACLTAQARKLGLANHVTFVGPKLPHELPDWYRAANVTVLPSWSEGLPNVLRESAACGTPFVASQVGGISEIADTMDRLVPPGDVKALQQALAAALARPADSAYSGQRFVGWDVHAETILSILRPDMIHAPRSNKGRASLVSR